MNAEKFTVLLGRDGLNTTELGALLRERSLSPVQ